MAPLGERGSGLGAVRRERGPRDAGLRGSRRAPAIDIASPLDGAAIAHRADVAARFSCTDPETGVDACTGTVADGQPLDTATLGEHAFTVQARNGDGARSTRTVTYRVVDVSAPRTEVTAPVEGTAYTRGEERLAAFRCVEEAGGSGLAACDGTVASGAPFATGTLGDKVFRVTSRDEAGNERVVDVPYSVVDRTPPTIEPESGQRFLLDSEGALTPACADEALGSGLESCVAQPVDTSVVGFHTVLVRAEDHTPTARSPRSARAPCTRPTSG